MVLSHTDLGIVYMHLAAKVPFFFNYIVEVSRYISLHYKRCDTSVASLAKKICVLEQRKSVKGLPGVLALIRKEKHASSSAKIIRNCSETTATSARLKLLVSLIVNVGI